MIRFGRCFKLSIASLGVMVRPRRILSLALAASLVLNGPFGILVTAQAQIVSDPRAPIQFQPRVGAAPNGVPLIDITKPSFGGLSHNRFDQYNVDTRGVILNNSGLAGTSILGGQVPGNPNLANSRPAAVILNEVTGTNLSLLNGPTEVFGTRAEVIVANQNGVTCRSCSFINTGRVTLSTGVPIPDYQNGTVSFQVTRGAVRIEGSGVASINADGTVGRIGDLDLVGRQIGIDGTIDSSGHVRMRSGAINWDQNTDVASRLTGAGIPVVSGPAIASSAAGVLQAGTISAISYDVNLGVSFAGDMTALGLDTPDGRGGTAKTAGLVAVTSAGDLSLGSAGSTGDIRLEANGALTLSGANQAMGRITGFGNDVTVGTGAGLLANDAIILEAARDLSSAGYLQSGSAISLVAGGDASASGTILASGMIDLEGANVAANGLQMAGSSITVAGLGNVALEGTALVANDNIAVLGTDMRLGEGTAFQAGANQSGRIFIDARGTLTNATVLSYPNLSLNLGRSLVNEASGQIVFDDLSFILSDSIVNAGLIYGRNSAYLAAQTLDNTDSGVIYGPQVSVSVGQDMSNAGRILSEGDLSATVQGTLTNKGAIQANGAITLTTASYKANSAQAILAAAKADLLVSGALNNSGSILVDDVLTIVAGSLTNKAGARIAAYDAMVALSGNATNAGSIEALNLLNLSANNLTNSGSLVAYEISRVDGSDLVAGLQLSGKLDNSGVLQAVNNLLLEAKSLQNASGATLQGYAVSALVSKDLVNNGAILSNDILILAANNLVNAGTAASTATISGKYLQANVARDISNGGYGILQGTQSTVITAQTATLDLVHANDLSQGIFNYGKDLALTLTKQGLTIDAGRSLIADGSLYLSLGGDVNVFGILASRGDLSLSSGGSITVGYDDPVNPGGGEIFTRGNAEIIAARNISNYASVIQSLGDMWIQAGNKIVNTRTAQATALIGVFNPSPYQIARGDRRPEKYTESWTQTWETSNAAEIWADGNLWMTAGSVTNDASVISAGGVLKIDANKVTNTSRDTGVWYAVVKTGGSTNVGKLFFSGWRDGTHQETSAALTGGAGFDASGIGTFKNTGLIQAPVVRIDAQTLINGITDPNRITAPSRLPDPVINLGSYFNTPGGANPVVINGVRYLNGAPIPGDSTERGPSWILEQVGDIRTGLTFYADPTTEQRALTQAILDQTGRTLLDPSYRTPAEQQQALWQATVDFLQANPDIHLGDTLTDDQRARISQPILWYVSETVNGEQVLVPQLLLPEDRLEDWRRSNGGVIAADDMFLSGGSITNTGALLAQSGLSISADTFTNERRVADIGVLGGTMQHGIQDGGIIMGDVVQIRTTGDLYNIGGMILAGSAMNLAAEGNLVVTTAVVENEQHDGSRRYSFDYYSRENYGSLLMSGGDMSLSAGNDLSILGSTLISGGDMRLTAMNDVTIAAVTDETNLDIRTRRGNFMRRTSTQTTLDTETQVSSMVVSGGNLTVAAGHDVTVSASGLASGGDMLLAAGAGTNGAEDGSVRILNALNVTETSYSKKKTGIGVGSGEGWMNIYGSQRLTTASYDEENVASTLLAGGNLTILAKGDIDIEGSALVAQGQATLSAGRDISVTPGMNASGEYWKKEQSGFGIGVGFSGGEARVTVGTHRNTRTSIYDETQVVQSVIMGGEGVILQADRDILLAAADIKSQGDIAISAGHDLISLSVDQGAESYYSKKSSQVGLTVGLSTPIGNVVSGVFEANKKIKEAEKAYKAVGDYTGNSNMQEAVNYINAADKTLGVLDKINGILTNTTKTYYLISNASKIYDSWQGATEIDPSNKADANIKDLVNSVMIRVSLGASSQEKIVTNGQTVAVGTTINGNNVSLYAGNDMYLQGGSYQALGDLNLTAGHDLVVDTGFNTKDSSKETNSKSAEIGLKFQMGYNSDTKHLTFGQFDTGTGIQVYASASTSRSREWTEESTPVSAILSAGNNLTMTAGNDLSLIGAQVQSQRDMALSAGNDLTIAAAAGTGSSHSGSSSAGGSFGIGLSNGAISLSAKGSEADTDGWSVTWKNSHVTAGGALSLTSGNDTNIMGAVVKGDTINAQIGGDLNLVSLQDVARKNGDSKGFEAGIGSSGIGAIGLQGSYGQTDEKKDWVTEQTRLEGTNGTNVIVSGMTSIGGSVLNDTSGNLHLETGDLNYWDISGRDYKNNWSFTLNTGTYIGIGAGNGQNNNGWPGDKDKSLWDDSKVGGKGQITYQNKRQENYATIGEGLIIVGGVLSPELPGLNRDAQHSQIVTQDLLITTPTINFDQGKWGTALGNNSSTMDWINAGCSLISSSCGATGILGTLGLNSDKSKDSGNANKN